MMFPPAIFGLLLIIAVALAFGAGAPVWFLVIGLALGALFICLNYVM